MRLLPAGRWLLISFLLALPCGVLLSHSGEPGGEAPAEAPAEASGEQAPAEAELVPESADSSEGAEAVTPSEPGAYDQPSEAPEPPEAQRESYIDVQEAPEHEGAEAEPGEETSQAEEPALARGVTGRDVSGLSAIEEIYITRIPPTEPALRQFGYNVFSGEVLQQTLPVGSEYRLGPGDSLLVYLWGDPVDIGELQGFVELTVDRNGGLYFQPVGTFAVWGMSIAEVQEIITREMKRKFRKFELEITAGKLRRFPVFVSGYVAKPGPMEASAAHTVFDILNLAGGITKNGSLRNVLLRRPQGGVVQETRVDLYDFLVIGQPIDLRIREGDTIHVSEIGTFVGVAGAVKRPAIYELVAAAELDSVLALAGGRLPSAYEQGLKVTRYQNARLRLFDGGLRDLLFLKTTVESGDLLFLEKSRELVVNKIEVQGYVVFPGAYSIEETPTMGQALAKAGLYADTNRYYGELLRVELGGEKAYRTFVPAEILDGDKDLALKPQDIIRLYRFGDVKSVNLDLFKDAFIVQGYIRYPGVFAYREGFALSRILTDEDVLTDTNIYYGELIRQVAGKPKQYSTFIPSEILSGARDIELRPADIVRFYRSGEVDSVNFNRFRDVFIIDGHIKYPRVYAYRQGMKLSEFLTDEELLINTNVFYAELERQVPGQPKEYATFIPQEILGGATDIELKPLDQVHFYRLGEVSRVNQDNYRGAFALAGSIKYPGVYAYRQGMKLSEFLTEGQLLVDTNLFYGELERQMPGQPKQYATFIPGEILAGASDIELKPLDRLRFFRFGEVADTNQENYRAAFTLAGYIKYAGVYAYRPGMKLSDFFSEEELLIGTNLFYGELERQVPGQPKQYATFIPREILSGASDIELKPLDRLRFFRFGEVIDINQENYRDAFTLAGHIKYPGVYAYRQGMKLSELLTPENLLIETNLYYGELVRQPSDQPTQYSTFIPSEILAGDSDIEVEPLDRLRFYRFGQVSEVNREHFRDAFRLEGHIRYPGVYAYRQGMQLSDFLTEEDLLINTNIYYAELRRQVPHQPIEYQTFVPREVLTEVLDLELKPLDRLKFYEFGEVTRVNEENYRDAFTLEGHIKYAGVYAYRPGMKLSGFFSDEHLLINTNLYYAELERQVAGQPKQYQTFIPKQVLAAARDIELRPLDRLRFYRFGDVTSVDFDKFRDAVMIEGAIKYRGVYGITAGMKLSDIVSAQNLLMDTNLEYAQILRRALPDLKERLSTFSVSEFLSGRFDVTLENLDVITFLPARFQLPIQLSGEIEQSQVIPFYEGLSLLEVLRNAKLKADVDTLKAVITREPEVTKEVEILTIKAQEQVAAAGELPHASGPETGQGAPVGTGATGAEGTTTAATAARGTVVAQEIAPAPTGTPMAVPAAKAETQIITVYLLDLLRRADESANVALKAGDSIIISRTEETEKDRVVRVLGEVKNPGVLRYRAGMKLYDALTEAGGYTSEAYPRGMVFIRESAKRSQLAQLQQAIVALQESTARMSLSVLEGEYSAEEQALMSARAQAQRRQLEALQERAELTAGRIALDPPEALAQLALDANINIELDDADFIFVPKTPNYVLVLGEVYNQISLPYVPRKSTGDYVRDAGGIEKQGDEREIFIIKANGRVVSNRALGGSIFVNRILLSRSEPGDTIVIPQKKILPSLDIGGIIRDTSQTIADFASAVFSTYSILKQGGVF